MHYSLCVQMHQAFRYLEYLYGSGFSLLPNQCLVHKADQSPSIYTGVAHQKLLNATVLKPRIDDAWHRVNFSESQAWYNPRMGRSRPQPRILLETGSYHRGRSRSVNTRVLSVRETKCLYGYLYGESEPRVHSTVDYSPFSHLSATRLQKCRWTVHIGWPVFSSVTQYWLYSGHRKARAGSLTTTNAVHLLASLG